MTRIIQFLAKKQGLKAFQAASSQQIHRFSERGSAIIWIFVMIVLFAALNYAVSQNSRTGESNISEQQANLAATQILDYASAVKRAVQELQINGCTEDQINFENSIYKNAVTGLDYHPIGQNTNSPSDGSCSVYHPNGGGLTPVVFDLPIPTPAGASTPSGHAAIGFYKYIIGIGNDGVLDLIMAIPGMNEQICIKINDSLGITNPSGKPPVETTEPIVGDEATELAGKRSFCYFRNSAIPRYSFFQVLIAR